MGYHCKKMRLHLWRAKYVQSMVMEKAHRNLIRVARVCAQNISSAEEIADDLVEQDVSLIQKIMDVAPRFAPDYNVDAIYNALNL